MQDHDQPRPAAPAGGASEAERASQDAPPAEAPVVASPELEALQAENAALKDRLLRAMADMENMRRRTEKEVADARAYGMSKFALEMTSVADNLHRAVAAVPAEARALSPAVTTLIEGVELVERDLLARFQRFGVKRLEPQGQKFDPNFHEALFEVPDESLPHGAVHTVVEDGYSIADRVLRPAKVGVARGGPRASG